MLPSKEIQMALRSLHGLDLLLGEYTTLDGDLIVLRAAWAKSWAIHQCLTKELVRLSDFSSQKDRLLLLIDQTREEVIQMKQACKAKPMSMPKPAKAEAKEEKSEKKAIKKGKY